MQVLETNALITVGYEGRTADELLTMLVDAGVAVLADVRQMPSSRKPGLSKRSLAEQLEMAGIDYLHLPELGNPRENREAYRRGDARSRERFQAVLRTPQAQAALRDLRQRMTDQCIALLCFERTAECCHRQLVSDELCQGDSALKVKHL